MIDFDTIAANADRASGFRVLYRDCKKLQYFIRKHKETGDDLWKVKCQQYYRRMESHYPLHTSPSGMIGRDHHTFPILMRVCAIEHVSWMGYS